MSTSNKYEYCIELIQKILIYNEKLKRLKLRADFWQNEIHILELEILLASWQLEELLPDTYKTIVTNLSPLVPLLR